MDTYSILIGVPPVEADIPADGFRSEDRAFQRRIHELLIELLASAPFNNFRAPVYWLDPAERSSWAERIFTAAAPFLASSAVARASEGAAH
jgi:hypothetical protein